MLESKVRSSLPDICILGTGVCLPIHMSFETLDILNSCNSVYTIVTESDSEWFRDLVKTKIHLISNFYHGSRPRQENYDAAVSHIIEKAKMEKPIVYLTYGNPVFFDNVTQGLISTAQSENLSVNVFPAISFLDTILSKLYKDPAPGIHIYEATSFVRRKIQPRIDTALLLVQVHVFGTDYPRFEFKEEFLKSLNPLRDYLLNFYPENHPVTFVKTAMNWRGQDHIATYMLKDIDQVTKNDLLGTTLYIPTIF